MLCVCAYVHAFVGVFVHVCVCVNQIFYDEQAQQYLLKKVNNSTMVDFLSVYNFCQLFSH